MAYSKCHGKYCSSQLLQTFCRFSSKTKSSSVEKGCWRVVGVWAPAGTLLPGDAATQHLTAVCWVAAWAAQPVQHVQVSGASCSIPGQSDLMSCSLQFFNSISKGLVHFSTYYSHLTVCLTFLQVESEVSGSLCMGKEDYFIATNPTGLEVNLPRYGVTHARLADTGGHLSPFASSENVPLRWKISFCV